MSDDCDCEKVIENDDAASRPRNPLLPPDADPDAPELTGQALKDFFLMLTEGKEPVPEPVKTETLVANRKLVTGYLRSVVNLQTLNNGEGFCALLPKTQSRFPNDDGEIEEYEVTFDVLWKILNDIQTYQKNTPLGAWGFIFPMHNNKKYIQMTCAKLGENVERDLVPETFKTIHSNLMRFGSLRECDERNLTEEEINTIVTPAVKHVEFHIRELATLCAANETFMKCFMRYFEDNV